MPLWSKVLAGATIGGICAAIANPCDVILIRMQADGHWPVQHRRKYKNVFDGLIRVFQHEGCARLWRGCLPTVIRGVLITCSQLPAYHTAKYHLVHSLGFSDGTKVHIIASIISAGVASLITCPVDVIKTRMMNMQRTSSSVEYTSTTNCIVRTAQSEGLQGFYKGLGSTFARLGPHCVVLWVMQEQYLHYFKSLCQR